MNDLSRPWYKELNRYHWFVFVVAALGWLFDTLDQQLFVLARVPAMEELLETSPGVRPPAQDVTFYSGIATTVFMLGWATGGLGFGVLGDRIGRAKTMMMTILVYSLFTGLSAFSQSIWDFSLFRFLTGLGVGGEFAVGVSLVAEVMPQRARTSALGLLQALSAVGNISAALINNALGGEDFVLPGMGAVTPWRVMFVIGTIPALLAVVIRRRLKEPERWQAAAAAGAVEKKLGSYSELFGDPRWRHRAIVGMLLGSVGIVGLWGIGFFSPDLTRSVFRKNFEEEYRQQGSDKLDWAFLATAVQTPAVLEGLAPPVAAADLIALNDGRYDAQLLYSTVLARKASGQAISPDAVVDAIPADPKISAEARENWRRQLQAPALSGAQVSEHAKQIAERSSSIKGGLTRWAGYTSMMINIGAFFGIYMFSVVTQRLGRRITFALSFILAATSTAFVFMYLDDVSDVFWMVPIMGFCQLSLFGGYAVYFPELFPTHLRSTGTSFCYNVGRYVAAVGPWVMGSLAANVFQHTSEPMRYAGLSMCGVFLIGLLVLPFAPETKDQPLPE